jgi:hypothetical protein
VDIARAVDHELKLARSKTPNFPTPKQIQLVWGGSAPAIAAILAHVATVFSQVAPILAKVPAVLTAIAPPALVPRVADVLAMVAAILAEIPAILTAVEAIFNPIASRMTRRLGQCG